MADHGSTEQRSDGEGVEEFDVRWSKSSTTGPRSSDNLKRFPAGIQQFLKDLGAGTTAALLRASGNPEPLTRARPCHPSNAANRAPGASAPPLGVDWRGRASGHI